MPKKWLAAFAVLAMACPAFAESIAPDRIIDAAVGDWNKDGQQDLALLVAPPDEGDQIGIYIYVRDENHPLLKLVTAAPEKVWGNANLDAMFGQDPSITALANGSIAVDSQNIGIGRDRWEQTFTLALRNDVFVVAGYTYNYYDTLDLANRLTCDYNLLTGRVVRNGTSLMVAPKFLTIEAWSEETDRGPCQLN